MERPSSHESWYRVAPLRVRLRPGVRAQRQVFRGRVWHVLEDPAADTYHRLSDPAWAFVGRLGGDHTVGEALEAAQRHLGDDAPTEGEAITILGQMASNNLLAGEIPSDAESVLRRARTRRSRELAGRAASFLFVRVPLVDPDRFLDRWAGWVSWIFTGWGVAIWAVLVALGLAHIAGSWGRFVRAGGEVLEPGNLGWLYAAVVVAKLAHELGHGFACKSFARRAGRRGAVHTLGVMFLVFVPLPYVDASSAWTLRSRRQRVVVGAAGMLVETALAGIAAAVWARTAEGSVLAAVSFNLVLVAGVTTLLFNANPLLRYDGYYILADLTDTPNLSQRARTELFALVKRVGFGVRRVRGEASSRPEAAWLVAYALLSSVYRVGLALAIAWFVAGQWFVFGVVMALAAVVLWIVVPIGRFVGYLLQSAELDRVRGRALGVTGGAAAALVIVLLGVPVPDRPVVEGRVRAAERVGLFAGAGGFLEVSEEAGASVREGRRVVVLRNEALRASMRQAEAEAEGAEARARAALAEDPGSAAVERRRAEALRERAARLRERVAALEVVAPIGGVWSPRDDALVVGSYVPRGASLGALHAAGAREVVARAPQHVAARVVEDAAPRAEVLLAGERRPVTGAVVSISPSERREEGDAGGGTFYEVRVRLDGDAGDGALPGRGARVRFESRSKSIGVQAGRAIGRVFQERFAL